MRKNYTILGGLKTYSFSSRHELINFVIDKKTILIAINAEKILLGKNFLKKIVNDNIGYPDGIGAVWALKRHGFKKAIKIPGCELWLDIIAESFKEKSFYLIGAKAEVVNRTVYKLQDDYKGINILNFRDGYINSDGEKENLVLDIKKKRPDIVFVATGSPKQELLMQEMIGQHPALYMGLGGSFDVYVNNVKRAPKVFIDMNLEWLYRLIKQPQRIKRQLYYFRFIWMLILNKL